MSKATREKKVLTDAFEAHAAGCELCRPATTGADFYTEDLCATGAEIMTKLLPLTPSEEQHGDAPGDHARGQR